MLDDSFPTMGTVARVVRDGDGGVDVAGGVRRDRAPALSLRPEQRPVAAERGSAAPASRRRRCSGRRSAPRCVRRALSGGLVDPTRAGGAARRRLPGVPRARAARVAAASRWTRRRPGARLVPTPPPDGARWRSTTRAGVIRRPRGLELDLGGVGQGMGGRRPRGPARAARALRRRLWRRPAPGGPAWSAVGGARAPSADRRGRPHAPRPRGRRGDLGHRRATVGASRRRLRPPPDRPGHRAPRVDGAARGHGARPDRVGGRGAGQGRPAVRSGRRAARCCAPTTAACSSTTTATVEAIET